MPIFSLDNAGLWRYDRDLVAKNCVCGDTAKLLEMTAEAEWRQSTSWKDLYLAHKVLGVGWVFTCVTNVMGKVGEMCDNGGRSYAL